ncbi:serpin family protein [Rudanella paleaurantiibacter]|uniref:Serpin family protein n=1 Tax=Rudanella paleaurantiibacter TaxID=2614655 RepID=A0A7J5U3Q8_9BACT|nr:serpin family protein [Rudanella paleaurantiibacter]KAB7732489.1 serpin family protein [Rudanella paleaurantiibacter]
MKKARIGTHLLTTVATTLALVVGCTSSPQTPDPGSTAGSLRVSAPFAAQTTDFAFDLLKQVSAQDGRETNSFVSPLSLHMALGMLLNGAKGQTATEIQKTLKLDAQTLAEANQTYTNLLENLPGVDPKVKLTLANSVWYRQGFAVETSFEDVLRKSFKAEVTALDFASPTAKDRINTWASNQTNGKIQKVIEEVKPDHVMFLLNALYFKGDWKTEFKTEQTVEMPFRLASGATKNVNMMRLNTGLRRVFRPTYTAFELPYANGNFAMTVLLPAENSSADALINSLNGAAWTALQKDMTEGTIDIGMPRFTLNYEIQLNNILSKMGMPTAFSNAADLSGIRREGGLKTDFVKQNTFIAVDEKGTEAAAVTSIGIVVTSMPASYHCDRPFVFVIHEKTSGTVLFTGKIANPQTNG